MPKVNKNNKTEKTQKGMQASLATEQEKCPKDSKWKVQFASTSQKTQPSDDKVNIRSYHYLGRKKSGQWKKVRFAPTSQKTQPSDVEVNKCKRKDILDDYEVIIEQPGQANKEEPLTDPLSLEMKPEERDDKVERSMAEKQKRIKNKGALERTVALLSKRAQQLDKESKKRPSRKQRKVSPVREPCPSLRNKESKKRPSKKQRKVSPVREPCPVLPGTPEVPPPHVPQPREVEKTAPEASGPTRMDLGEDDAVSPPPLGVNPLVLAPSTGVITVDELAPDSVIIDASIELLGFPPGTSFSAECSTLQAFSPGPSTSFAVPDPWIYEYNLEENAEQLEYSVSHYPGSDAEDDDDCLDIIGPRQRHVGEFAVEHLSGELGEVLESMDRQDDVALRESCQEDMLTFDWSHDPEVFTGMRESFTGPAGPTFPTEGMSPFQIFAKIWDEDIINLMVNETNKYAALLVNPALPPHSRLRKWVPITSDELFTFFGVIMLQSIVPIPVEREYWYPCLPYFKLPAFGDNIMSYPRFCLIKRCLHFVDNKLCARGIPNKLTKIQPIIDHLNSKFSSLYLPEQNIAIDESLLLWKGRLSFSQAIATKAAQVGIKSYELCESRTGYLWQMIIYSGKKEHNKEVSTNTDELEGAASKVVLKLVRPLLNKGHTLVMDNFYNSPLLARTLKAQKTDVMGTLRLNREFVPDSLRCKNKENMRTGEVAFSQARDMTITVWKDSNVVVSLISTYHKVEVGGQEKHGNYRYKPKVVLDYNLSMGGVDKKDQLLQAFPIERVRNQIWYKKLFRRLLNVSIHNAFVMFAKDKMAQRQFRVMLAEEIIKRFRPPQIAPPRIHATSHFPGKTNVRKSRCKWCARKKVDTCTAYKCDTCNVNLCIIGCFRDYHISQGLEQ